MFIDAERLDHRSLNEEIRNAASPDITLENCCGQRFIASGMSNRSITINGIPGNALGAYLNGAEIVVNGNAQDAVGDTMDSGRITVDGNIGDAAGYAMRGGEIYIKGNAGYRAGIHMKEYQQKRPAIVIGGKCGSFLGEYQAGGIIVVLGLEKSSRKIVGNFPCTGMHGGKVFLRSDCKGIIFPKNVTLSEATPEDMKEIESYIFEFCRSFGYNKEEILACGFTKIVPDSKNPYQQMYVAN